MLKYAPERTRKALSKALPQKLFDPAEPSAGRDSLCCGRLLSPTVNRAVPHRRPPAQAKTNPRKTDRG